MKKIKFYLGLIRATQIALVATLVIALASCSKEKTVDPVSPATQRQLAKATYIFDGNTPEQEVLTYDDKNWLSSFDETNYFSSFDYSQPGKINIVERKKSDNSLHYTKECILNEKGAITEITYKNGAGTVSYVYKFTYNEEGYIIKVWGAYPGSSAYEEVYEYVNGNPVSSKVYYGGVLSATRQYFFDESKPNKDPYTAWYYWPSYTLFGKILPHRIIEYKSFNANAQLTWHAKMKYQLNSEGYSVGRTTDYVHQGTQEVATFEYK